jgi:cell wall-associated NlpC family hydrolase
VVARHLAEEGRFARDFVEIAERFIGTPYLWGGRTRLGLDCSALVQLALEASGRSCPRDSDLQQAQVGVDVLVPPDLEGLERGDLVFWQGHVGIMMDGVMMVHANAHHMAVAVEPLKDAADRAARLGNRITAVKRIPALP